MRSATRAAAAREAKGSHDFVRSEEHTGSSQRMFS